MRKQLHSQQQTNLDAFASWMATGPRYAVGTQKVYKSHVKSILLAVSPLSESTLTSYFTARYASSRHRSSVERSAWEAYRKFALQKLHITLPPAPSYRKKREVSGSAPLPAAVCESILWLTTTPKGRSKEGIGLSLALLPELTWAPSTVGAAFPGANVQTLVVSGIKFTVPKTVLQPLREYAESLGPIDERTPLVPSPEGHALSASILRQEVEAYKRRG